MNTLVFLINIIYRLLIFLIFLRAIISWFRPNSYSPAWRSFLKILYDLTEPILGPIRRLLPAFSGIDFSPIIAFFLLYLVRSFLINLVISIGRDLRL
ncbi:MAG TPA: YggT family protein [Halanaerobiales bacterium]|nr:YggT family protein [Halanaerobiales bacterium]